MNSLKCFLLAETDLVRHELRRYSPGENNCCGPFRYHNAEAVIAPVLTMAQDECHGTSRLRVPREDPRWPVECGCGYRFVEEDKWQDNYTPLWRRSDTGELVTLHDAPIGAMWHADWLNDWHAGPDGRCLIVRCPANPDWSGQHDWMVDGRASNCTMKEDNVHRCWVRHGVAPEITVDKNGVSCRSIMQTQLELRRHLSDAQRDRPFRRVVPLASVQTHAHNTIGTLFTPRRFRPSP